MVWLQILHRFNLSGLGVWSVYLAGKRVFFVVVEFFSSH